MHLYLLFSFLLAHWIADFVMQTHWMAVNKSKNWRVLTALALVYTGTLGLVLLALGTLIGPFVTTPAAVVMLVSPSTFLIWVGLNGVLHWITDALTSRWTARLWRKADYYNFFVVVGLDQLIHYVTLITTWVLLATYLG